LIVLVVGEIRHAGVPDVVVRMQSPRHEVDVVAIELGEDALICPLDRTCLGT
jgi:hypothetical protein